MRSIRLLVPVAVAAILAAGALSPVDVPRAAATTAVAAEATPPVATVFKTPLTAKSYSVSSYYGPRCMPLPGASTFHLGLDMATPQGRAISAIAAGIVVETVDGTKTRAGYIKLRHLVGGVIYTSFYYHIWDANTHVKVGQKVSAGQRISEVGASGDATGPHLHLEIWKGAPGSANPVDPATFMKTHGVDLYAGASAITAKRTPATCTYYATTAVNLRTGPATTSPSIRVLPLGTAVVHVPGQSTDGFLPVKVGSTKGWVSSLYVSPTKPVIPQAKPASAPVTYKTTTALNLRASASLKAKVILVIPKSADIGSVKATSGVWRKITYKGKTGWVSSAYLTKR